MTRAASAGSRLVSESGRVVALPPPPGGRYFRISIHDESGRRIGQTSGGTTEESALRKLTDIERRLAAHSPAGASAIRGADLLDYFLAADRPKNISQPNRPAEWSASYTDQTTHLVNHYLRPVLALAPLASWSSAHCYAVLDRGPTNYLVAKLRRTLSAVLGVGVANGFLRPDQRDLHKVAVPLRPERRPRRTPPARQADATALLRPDEVPSLDEVARLACSTPPGWHDEDWSAAINTLTYLGTRVGEFLALSDDDVLHPGRPPGLIAIQWQLIEPRAHPKRLAPPKNGFGRLTAVCETTPLGFPLRSWLTARAVAAREERSSGRNPHGTLFLSPGGQWWTRSNFRSRCFNPSALTADWERLAWRGPVRCKIQGRWRWVDADRYDWRHPLHALRHHYACTARDTWGWTGAELCLNGGWADEGFVLSRYYGSTAETYRAAVAKQAASATATPPPVLP